MEQENKDNIILIGMPASGKSTVGVILAKIAGYDFIDTDLIIQRKTGEKLRTIIARRGIDGFLAVENAVCKEIDASHTVIATGGSAVYGKEGMEHLKKIGTVVYLDTAYPVLEKRLRNIRSRGVVIRAGQTLADLYEERIPLYRRYADLVIEEAGADSEAVVSMILEKMKLV